MKTIFTFAYLFLALLTAKAQTTDPTPEQLKAQAIEQSRELAQKIGLNQLEYIKIRNYTFQKLLATQEVNQMYANDAGMRAKKLAAIEEEFLQHVVATLTPRQHLNYVTLSSLE